MQNYCTAPDKVHFKLVISEPLNCSMHACVMLRVTGKRGKSKELHQDKFKDLMTGKCMVCGKLY